MNASILFADVIGYSALMETAEEETQVLTAYAIALFSKRCTSFGGRVIQVQGDGILIIFSTALESLRFATAIQKNLRNADLALSDGELIQFRIGIHHGKVLDTASGVRGHTVNVAARVQEFSEAGETCVTLQVLQALPDCASAEFPMLEIGIRNLKNIQSPFKLYRVGFGSDSTVSNNSDYVLSSLSTRNLDKRPSVVINPFLKTGISRAEDLISEALLDEMTFQLSRRLELTVRSPAIFSNDAYRRNLILRLCRSYGIDYLVEGTVTCKNGGFTIRGRLLRTFDARIIGNLTFNIRRDNLQRDILFHSVRSMLQVLSSILSTESSDLNQPVSKLGHYQKFLLAQRLAHKLDEKSNRNAVRLLEELVNENDSYSQAWVELSHARHMAWRYDWGHRPGDQLESSIYAASQAILADPNNSSAHSELGFAQIFADDLDAATRALQQAYSLNPVDPGVLANMSDAMMHAGRKDTALALINRSLALNDTLHGDWRIWSSADVHFSLGNYENVVDSVNRMRDWTQGSRLAAASMGLLGREKDAEKYKSRILTMQPHFSVGDWAKKHPSTGSDNFVAPFVKGMLKVGMPE